MNDASFYKLIMNTRNIKVNINLFIWALFVIWLTYSLVLFSYFHKQGVWVATICKVA